MNRYSTQIEDVLRAAAVDSPTTFSWFGKRSPRIVRSVERELTARTARNFLLYNLQSRLYSDFYCRGGAAPARSERPGGTRLAGDAGFVDELSAANDGRGYWESGWEVQRVEGGLVAARRGGLSLLAYPTECLVGEGGDVVVGTGVKLRFAKESRSVSPGFYMTMGDTDLGAGEPGQVLRFYWNIAPKGAVVLVREITRRLNEAGIRFRLKAINDPQQFIRCDAAVLYVRKEDYPVVEPIMGQVYAEVAGHIHPGVPALTRAVAPGLGMAEDPGDGDSFGMHRCRLVAEGIVRAYETGRVGLKDRMQCVADVFAEEGISLEAPYLAPGSDEYRVESSGWQETNTTRAGHRQPSDFGQSYSPLEMAHKLGRQIVGDAVWYEGRCNWIGAEVTGDDKGGGLVRTIYRALGPDFYAGTAGIAFFLGELYRATGDDDLRATALGAVRQALSRVEDIPAEGRMGLYTGGMGIALATVRLGMVLGDQELVEAGRTVARTAMQTPVGTNHDLLAGSAGAIVGCLLLAQMVGDASFLHEDALRVGGAVVEAAHKRAGRFSWGDGGRGAGRDLTGFSHGTAGIGYALLELWAASGEEEYKRAAEGAFEYERKWFDPEQANWPDFRETTGGRRAQKGAHAFATAWCHGAPGIALSRLRAYDLLGGEAYREEMAVALRTTRRAVESELVSGLGNYSLCHGLGGNASVLLHAQKREGKEMAGTEQLACAVGEAGAARYGNSGAAWPCGVGAEQTPSLMLGLAGIGHFYLRLYDRSVPCVLMLDKEEWGRA